MKNETLEVSACRGSPSLLVHTCQPAAPEVRCAGNLVKRSPRGNSEGQVSDYRGAAAMLTALPDANMLIADKGYDSDWFREALESLGIEPCIPGRSGRKEPVKYDEVAYKQRNRIERMFGKLKDWRRIATRYDRCAHAFMSAIAIAATVIFWL
jgi:transposase